MGDPERIALIAADLVTHFEKREQAMGGKAKAIIVTSSRLHAMRYKLAVDAYLKKMGSPYKALVAFTDVVNRISMGSTL